MTVTTAQYTQTGGTLALNLGDRIVVTGSGTPLTLAGLLDVTALPGYSITPGVYTHFDNQNTTPVAGRFYGRPEGATVSVGDRNLIISYFGAAYVGDPYSNNVILTLSAPPPPPPPPANTPPVAYDDYATTYEDQPVSGYVLANDTDADGHALAAALLSSTANGTVSLGANGFFLYTPAANFSGYDSFDYAVADGYGGTDVGTVWITVIAVNDPPVLPPYTFTTDEDDSCGGVVSGSDPDGDVLIYTVETGPMHGTVILNPDGSFTYTPDENYHGTDEFGYSVSDGHGGSATGTVTFTIASVNDGPAITGNNGLRRDGHLRVHGLRRPRRDGDRHGDRHRQRRRDHHHRRLTCARSHGWFGVRAGRVDSRPARIRPACPISFFSSTLGCGTAGRTNPALGRGRHCPPTCGDSDNSSGFPLPLLSHPKKLSEIPPE